MRTRSAHAQSHYMAFVRVRTITPMRTKLRTCTTCANVRVRTSIERIG